NCMLPGEDNALPPRAQTAHQQADQMVKVIATRLAGRAAPAYRYRDYGSVVSLADYGAFGSLIGGLKIEGLIARLVYRSLYKMHLKAVHGLAKTMLAAIGEIIVRRARPRIKLH
ncbi:MAG: NAD(P)/FAD-dependent oxidoreductase, partial [Mesorhizobium sp.]